MVARDRKISVPQYLTVTSIYLRYLILRTIYVPYNIILYIYSYFSCDYIYIPKQFDKSILEIIL